MNNNFHTLNENFNILSSYLMGKCIENNKPEIDLLKNKRYIYHSTIHKQWRTFRPSFHCELFYFFLRKNKYHNKLKTYYLPLKFKLKIFLKKIILSIDYIGVFNKLFDTKKALIEIQKYNFIKNNRTDIYNRFRELS